MKLLLVLGAVAISILVACSKQQDQQQQQAKSQPDQQQLANPFLVEWDTPFGVPPFDKIELAYYQPAFDEAVRQHNEEIDAILADPSAPTFANTIEALERSGALLSRVSNVFFAMNSSLTNEDMQEIAKVVAPELSNHEDEILLNDKLFQRVKSVYEQKDALGLNPEQLKLLDEHYKGFVRGGANLNEKDKARLTEINGELSKLSLQFGENVLKENNRFELVIENEADLSGLSEAVINAAKETAKERGHEGKWVFTLHKPSMIPFLRYSDKRDLREKIYKAYYNRGNNEDELDNKKILARMAALRAERAKLLGYETHAHYVLEDNMAKEPKNVYELLRRLWSPALERANAEAAEMQQMIDAEGGNFKLASWDWWYYAEKVKKAKYDLDEEMLRPYFKLENVRQGVFGVAGTLFGLR
ncbi:MAG: peptidase M3, partial [Candidatus Krumholzibacteria bacterium]|nr:peptidase M3 [Candidatus Krumholzibacteria bacterium]